MASAHCLYQSYSQVTPNTAPGRDFSNVIDTNLDENEYEGESLDQEQSLLFQHDGEDHPDEVELIGNFFEELYEGVVNNGPLPTEDSSSCGSVVVENHDDDDENSAGFWHSLWNSLVSFWSSDDVSETDEGI